MSKKKKRILCLGNSNTYGYDPRGAFGGRYPETVRWTGRLAAAGWEVFNRGMNGGMIPAGGQAAALLDLAESLRPLDVVTVMFGTNDVLQGGSAETAGERMEQFVRSLKERVEEADIILIAPPPVTFGDWVQSESVIRQSAALSGAYRRAAAAAGARFADAGEWGVGLMFDGVHFTEAGHEAFFEGLSLALTD